MEEDRCRPLEWPRPLVWLFNLLTDTRWKPCLHTPCDSTTSRMSTIFPSARDCSSAAASRVWNLSPVITLLYWCNFFQTLWTSMLNQSTNMADSCQWESCWFHVWMCVGDWWLWVTFSTNKANGMCKCHTSYFINVLSEDSIALGCNVVQCTVGL